MNKQQAPAKKKTGKKKSWYEEQQEKTRKQLILFNKRVAPKLLREVKTASGFYREFKTIFGFHWQAVGLNGEILAVCEPMFNRKDMRANFELVWQIGREV